MSVDDAAAIDGLGIAESIGQVVLTISDHLPWDAEPQHFRMLEEKISGYLNFIQSGQLIEILPHAAEMPIRIDIIYMHLPTESAMVFLDAAKQQLRQFNINLAHFPILEN